MNDAPRMLLAYLFRSCVAFYNAKPWKVLGETDAVRINVDIEAPVFAYVSGGETGTAPGVSLVSAYTTAQELEIANEELAIAARDLEIADDDLERMRNVIAFSGARLSMTFVPEHEAPQWMRDLRRANKWPLASPSAFPTCVATEEDGTMRELHDDELRTLSVAISVMAMFVATKRKQIESREPHGDVVNVRDDAGVPKMALVQFPFDPDEAAEPDGWQAYKLRDSDKSHANPALQELRNAALDLPEVSPILDRLAWSFFQDADPHYVPTEEDRYDAIERFLAWALFAYRANGTTLAERALLQLGETRSRDELDMHRWLVQPRAGLFRVVKVKRDVGMQLHDVLLGDTLDVVERVGTRGVRADNGVAGMLHPISATQWVLSLGVAMYKSMPDAEPDEEALSVELFAPDAEALAFGAGTEWIQDVDAEFLPDVYALFADAVNATGDVMPTYDELQRDIAQAEQPSQLAEKFAGRAWWTVTEMNVMLAFLMRVWNATPRDELGRKSPEEKFEEPGPVRTAPRKGGRRKR